MVVHVPLRCPPDVVVVGTIDAAAPEVPLEAVPGRRQLTHVPLVVQFSERSQHFQVQRDLMH